MEHYATTIAKGFREEARVISDPRLRAVCEERAAYYEALANETLARYFLRTERERVRRTQGAPFLTNLEARLREWFGGEHPAYILPNDLGTLIDDVMGRSVAPKQYGPIMRRLGFDNPVERREEKMERVWRRGRGGGRYMLSRDQNGRLMPIPPLPY